MKRFILLILVVAAGCGLASAQPAVSLTARIEGQALSLGAPIVLTVRATNGTEEPQQLGNFGYFNSLFTVQVTGPDGEIVAVYPIIGEAQRTGMLMSDDTATPPGGYVENVLVLNGIFDMNRTGEYTVDLSLRVGMGADTVRARVAVPISPPPPHLAVAVADYIRAVRVDVVAFDRSGEPVTEPPLTTFTRVAEQAADTYLAETALAHAVLEGAGQGMERARLGRDKEAEPMLRAAIRQAAEFLARFPTSLFAPGVVYARTGADAALGAESLDLRLLSVCQGQVFRIVNREDAPRVASYRVIGSDRIRSVLVDPDTVATIACTNPVSGIELVQDGVVRGIALSERSTCPAPIARLLPPAGSPASVPVCVS